jgi:hypothetical protein
MNPATRTLDVVAAAATGLRRLASAIERAGGEDTGSEGAS